MNAGRVGYGKADIFLAEVGFSYQTRQVLHYAEFLTQNYISWGSPLPRQLPKYESFIRPFGPILWGTIFGSIVIFGFVLKIIAAKEVSYLHLDPQKSDWATFSQAYWYCFGTIIGESITKEKQSSDYKAVRFALSVWILFCLVMGACYSGNLRAFLVRPSLGPLVDSLPGIAELEDITVAEEVFPSHILEILDSTNPDFRTIWKKKHFVPYSPVPDLLRVVQGETAFFEWRSAIIFAAFLKYSKPGFGQSLLHVSEKPVLSKNYMSFCINKYKPWTEAFNLVIRRLRDAGILNQLEITSLRNIKIDFMQNGGKAVDYVEEPLFSALSLEDMQGIFLFYGIGILITFMGALTELRGFAKKSK